MLDTLKIAEIAGAIARDRITASNFERVLIELVADSQGDDALKITLVLKPLAADRLTGDEALDLLVGIQQGLRERG